MLVNGIDVSKLQYENKTLVIPVVKDRTVHIDGDFLAYMVAYDNTKSLKEMEKSCDFKAEKIRLMCGAEHVVIHLTPKESNKGHRKTIALLREYQINRKGKIRPKFLHIVRAYMHEAHGGIQHVNCEADDGMAMAQYKAIAEGKRNLSVIATKDKDLTMVPGLQVDWDTGVITDTKDDFGYIRLDDSKSTKKIRGRGTKMFWAQMLTGDAADNISGLPMCCNLQYLPRGKYKSIGPVLAYEVLKDITSDKEAFRVVRSLYNMYNAAANKKDSGMPPFTNWRDGTPITAGQALVSEAQLLWMRRSHDPRDVINWMTEKCV